MSGPSVKQFLRYALLAIGLFAAVSFLINTDLLAPTADSRPLLIAHRGLGQTFHREGLTGATCTASRIFPPEHPYLENTIEGFAAAFAAGADIVEFDVHPTTDGDFVVFHDWTVDCRTEGRGVTREKSLAELKALDIGYGYTADGGETFPFRGKGVGLMPTLGEVLAAFPDKRFLINIKSDDVGEGERLAAAIGALPDAQQSLVMVYGGGKAVAAYKERLPAATVLGTDGAIRCFIRHGLLGWSGYVPEDCRFTLFMVPANFSPYIWGFPHRLAARLKAHGTTLVALGDNEGTRYTTGVDDLETLSRLPEKFDGAIWTNRIDRIGPAVLKR
jgi:glycerophosphoryl diester phosphodiesterase